MLAKSGFDRTLKFCLIGASCCGKSCLKLRILDDIFQESYVATVGPEFGELINSLDGIKKLVKISIWDGPGSKVFTNETKLNAVLSSCDGAFVVFDITDRSSFEKIEYYVSLLKNHSPHCKMILIGHKSDMYHYRAVTSQEAIAEARRIQSLKYIEVSSLSGNGVFEAMNYLEYACLDALEDMPKYRPQSRVNHANTTSSTATDNISGSSGKESSHSTSNGSISRSRKDTVTDTLRDFMGKSNANNSEGINSNKKKEKKSGSKPTYTRAQAIELKKWYPKHDSRANVLESFKFELKEGMKVLVYPHDGGSPEYNILQIDKVKRRLYWDNSEVSSAEPLGMYLNDIAEIRPFTQMAFPFKQMKIPRNCEGGDCLFTVIGSECSVSMGARSAEQCRNFVIGLKLITECVVPTAYKIQRGKLDYTLSRLQSLCNGKYLHPEDGAGLEEHTTDTQAVEFLTRLKDGIEVLYCRLNGRRSPKELRLDGTTFRLILSDRAHDHRTKKSFGRAIMDLFRHSQRGIDLDDISEIRPGFQAYTFSAQNPAPHPMEGDLALTIIGSECSLSVLLPTQTDRNIFVSQFQQLLRTIRPELSIF